MRRLAAVLVLVVVAASSTIAAPTSGDTPTRSRSTGTGIGLRLPPGWHLIHRRLTDVIYPVPRLAVASFRIRLARRPCACGEPAIRDFPPTGAFLFVWEWAHYPADELHQVPSRPRRFAVSRQIANPACTDLVWSTSFRDSRRVFQVEVYLGPRAGGTIRGRMDALLDSLEIARPR